ncbi:MAG: N(G),N(G)-dimethylarginine dimethylaminohydrolase [Lachnospiraceae bacterium]|nr:N(G),N(G)-dimethylarginine dimethylaminohydrolase [Lachnospiraceae bacterium]
MFNHAIVRTPCPKVCDGITSAPELGQPIYEKALEQHAKYIEALKACGVDVLVLPAMEEYPDSCFVEDVAVVNDKCAIITNPGADTRKGETAGIIEAIGRFYTEEQTGHIVAPGTLEGGDVMKCGDTYYVGLSARTNQEGFDQFAAFMGKYGFKSVLVPLELVLHLKTGVNYLENNKMLVSGEFVDKPEFAQYERIVIPDEEAYAANCIWMNGTVIVPEGYPAVLEAVKGAGYPVLTVDTSEFRKIDGGLSCLSLRF